MRSIFDVFAPSPIRPMVQHMRKVTLCAVQLYFLFKAALKQDWEIATKVQKRIVLLEQEADEIKKDLRLHLPSGLFLPVARTDLLELLATQDRIANKAEHIASLVVSRKMCIPPSISPLFMPFLHRCLDTAKQAYKAIYELDELLETGFRGSEVNIVEGMIVKLDALEQDCDKKLADIQSKLFEVEHLIPPIEVIFLYKLLQWIGDLADHAQMVGARLQVVIAR